MRKENRASGFHFEDYIIERYNLIPSDSYTHKWDAFFADGSPVSIKTVGINNEIGFGNIFRQANIEEEMFYLIVGVWQGTKENIEDVYVVKMKTAIWNRIFNMELIDDIQDLMNKAKTGIYSNDDNIHKWEEQRDLIQSKWSEQTPNLMRPRLRIVKDKNGKMTFRPQCSIIAKHFVKHFTDNSLFQTRKLDPVVMPTMKSKSTKSTQKITIEDTEYGKKIVEESTVEVVETYDKVEEDKNVKPANLFDIVGMDEKIEGYNKNNYSHI